MIDRKRLYRGNKLTIQRVNEVHDGVEAEFSAGIGADQQPGTGRFAVDWNLPSIEAYMFDGLVGNEANYSKLLIPFMIPPPQDYASSLGVVGDETPQATLRRLSISFDQAMSGVAMTDMWDANVYGAGVDYELQSGGYDFTIELRRKTPGVIASTGLGGTASDNVPSTLVWSQEVSGTLFAGGSNARSVFNPLVIEDLQIPIQPYSTYVWYIRFTGLVNAVDSNGTTRMLGVSSFHLRGEFEYPLLVRDNTAGPLGGLQNAPTVHGGARQPASIALDTATAGSLITANTGLVVNGRVQRNLDLIDQRFGDRLKGGYRRDGALPLQEELIEDQTLSVIAVPMFGQFGDIRASDINLIGLPWGPAGDFEAAPWPGVFADRRVIRIQHPFVLHTVLAVANYYSPPTTNGAKPGRMGITLTTPPASPTVTNRIGVGIASGIDGADDRRYQQVAYLEYTPATKLAYLLDRIKEGGTPQYYGLGSAAAYDHELFSVPLVYPAPFATGPFGTNSGTPVYLGRAGLAAEGRTAIAPMPADFGGGAAAAPATNGREQFIEVRWTIEDAAGLSPDNPAVAPETAYIGNGGCWVYLIGKKSPTSIDD